MARACDLDSSVKVGKLSKESREYRGEVLRDYDPVKDVQWRFGKPNYARVNKTYGQYRSKRHAPSSLEAVVQKIVKNWEVESHHIANPEQWKTMDHQKFRAFVNGAGNVTAQQMAEVGPYNMLIGKIAGYDGTKETFESANDILSNVFTEGFAFEVLEVYSGPPNVSFRWRHFGRFTGSYVDDEGVEWPGTRRLVELFGLCVAKVTAELVIEELQVYYDPQDMIKPLMVKSSGGLCGACCATDAGEEEDDDGDVEQQS